MVQPLVVVHAEGALAVAQTYEYVTVDVFTSVALEGNPLAVFTDARGLETAQMQRIARELNLSETTFILPPADAAHTAQVRIFTPQSELPFAGHPTLGTTFVLRGDSGKNAFVLEEAAGNIHVRVASGDDGATQFWLTAPPVVFGERVAPEPVAKALGLRTIDLLVDVQPEIVSAGPPFLFVPLKNRAIVDRIEMLDPRLLREAVPKAPTGVYVFARLEESDSKSNDTNAVYSRLFAPEQGIAEDPATGSAVAPMTAMMIRRGLLPLENGLSLVAEQGTKMGRRSLLHALVHVADGGEPSFEVGGSVVPVARATMTL
jgi:trans-2,3-dihydro-3-hydroxyanthranilate isomerase